MANIRTLVEAVAHSQGLDEVQVGVYARAAREAGLITHKGRGRHAAQMTVQDAANLLIAATAPLAKDAPTWIGIFRPLSLAYSFDPVEYLVDISGLTFGAALETLISRSVDSDLDAAIQKIAQKKMSRLRERVEQEGLSLPLAKIEIEFRRPALEALIRVRRPSQIYQGQFLFIDDTEFSYGPAKSWQLQAPDRTDAVTFSQRTLAEVARAISS